MLKNKKVEVKEISKEDKLIELLKQRIPKLFDREPGSYSEQRLVELTEEIIGL